MENGFSCSAYDLRCHYIEAQMIRDDDSKPGILTRGKYSPTGVKKTQWSEDLT